MKTGKLILILFTLVVILPLLSLFALTFRHTGAMPLKWYSEVLHDQGFRSALRLSATVALLTTLAGVALSFLLALSWYQVRQRQLMVVLVLLLGLIPGDVLSLSINKLANLCGFYSSNIFFWVAALVCYTLPFNVLILWARFYFIDRAIVTSARDLGLNPKAIVFKIIVPLSAVSLASCATLTFLLSLNEYSRTYYLSGSMESLSEFLNGQLSSGTDESIYAGAGLTVLTTLVLVILLTLLYTRSNSKNKKQNISPV